jgi:hypothetical protein
VIRFDGFVGLPKTAVAITCVASAWFDLRVEGLNA